MKWRVIALPPTESTTEIVQLDISI